VDAAILIVLHTANAAASLLPQILARVSKLPVCHPADWDPIERGMVYIAPPAFNRPAIDPLFRSAAAAYGRDRSESSLSRLRSGLASTHQSPEVRRVLENEPKGACASRDVRRRRDILPTQIQTAKLRLTSAQDAQKSVQGSNPRPDALGTRTPTKLSLGIRSVATRHRCSRKSRSEPSRGQRSAGQRSWAQ
jgi:hypothetical protein